jgi:hypothetical protein
MAPTKNAPASKKHPLTLAQLAAYDDILTDALVDHVSYELGRLRDPPHKGPLGPILTASQLGRLLDIDTEE